MTTSAQPRTATIHGLGQSIAALPYQLGYHPTASLVLLCMGPATPLSRGSRRLRGSVTLIARVDLGSSSQQNGPVASLEPALLRADVASVVALAFEDECDNEINTTPTLVHVAEIAAAHKVSVVASVRVRSGRFATIDAFGRTGTWEDLPHDGDVPVIAEYVVAGKSPARDRASVESVLSPADEILAAAVQTHLRADATGNAREAARTICSVISDPGCRPSDLEPSEVAGVAVALREVDVRDAVLSRLSPPLGQPGLPGNDAERQVAYELGVCDRVDGPSCFRLAALAGYIPRPEAAPMLTLVGYLAWQAGEGALANITISAALDVDPDYSLARLVDVALSSALRPPTPV